MSKMMNGVAFMGLVLVSSTLFGEDCIPKNSTQEVCADRPKLATTPGTFAGGYYDGAGNPQGFEDDTFSDDPMGEAEPSADGARACLEVENKNGRLSGPNGDVQNTGLEGDCIEVKICWDYYYIQPGEMETTTVSSEWLGTTTSTSTTETQPGTVQKAQVCSVAQQVCPCK